MTRDLVGRVLGLMAIVTAAILFFTGCAEVQTHQHFRPKVGCYQQICGSDGYECWCWDAQACFLTEYSCSENLKSTVTDLEMDLYDILSKTNQSDTI